MTASSLGLIWAQARGGAIGRDGVMPWHLPEDLAHFKRVTLGHPVVMGRRTWDSIEPRFRPLTGRRNIVVTRDEAWSAEGAEVAHSVGAALALACDGEVWVAGGGQLYAATIALADRLEVTEVDLAIPDADTFAPAIGPEWVLADIDPADGFHESRTGAAFRFLGYRRAPR